MKVLVEYTLRFREVTGKALEEVLVNDGSTLNDLISALYVKYGARFMEEFNNPSGDLIGGRILILVNGDVVSDLNIKLRDGDKVTLTYLTSGG